MWYSGSWTECKQIVHATIFSSQDTATRCSQPASLFWQTLSKIHRIRSKYDAAWLEYDLCKVLFSVHPDRQDWKKSVGSIASTQPFSLYLSHPNLWAPLRWSDMEWSLSSDCQCIIIKDQHVALTIINLWLAVPMLQIHCENRWFLLAFNLHGSWPQGMDSHHGTMEVSQCSSTMQKQERQFDQCPISCRLKLQSCSDISHLPQFRYDMMPVYSRNVSAWTMCVSGRAWAYVPSLQEPWQNHRKRRSLPQGLLQGWCIEHLCPDSILVR